MGSTIELETRTSRVPGMVARFRTVLSPEDRLALPQDVRHALGLDDAEEVLVVIADGTLRILPGPWTLDQIQGTAKTDRIFSEDFDEEIEEAMEEALRDKYR